MYLRNLFCCFSVFGQLKTLNHCNSNYFQPYSYRCKLRIKDNLSSLSQIYEGTATLCAHNITSCLKN